MVGQEATGNTAQERLDAAVVDAYARRVAGEPATDADDTLDAEIAAAELAAYAQLHRRVADLPLPEVAPGVRSVVLTAAALGAQEHAARRRQQAPLARLLVWLMRPGPLMALATGGDASLRLKRSAALSSTGPVPNVPVVLPSPTWMVPPEMVVEP